MFIPRCKGMATFSAGKKYGIPRSRHFSNRFYNTHTYLLCLLDINLHVGLYGKITLHFPPCYTHGTDSCAKTR